MCDIALRLSGRSVQREEQRPLQTRGTNLPDIEQNRAPDTAGERMRTSRLRTAYLHRLLLPVQIVEAQADDFSGA